jgi:hypothetical protein
VTKSNGGVRHGRCLSDGRTSWRSGLAGCLLMMAVVATASGQQFRDPAMPSNASPGFNPHLSLEAQLHADAIRRQMLRAQREQGAPAGFAENAYRAQQIYAAQQAYDNLQANPLNQISQTAHNEGNFAGQPTGMSTATAPATGLPPVHLTPGQTVYRATSPHNSGPAGQNQYSHSRPQNPVTPLNDRNLSQPSKNVAAQVPDPKFPASMQPRQPTVRLQERISRALVGSRRLAKSANQTGETNYHRTQQRSAQRRKVDHRVPNDQVFVAQQQSQPVRQFSQPAIDSSRPTQGTRATRQTPPRRQTAQRAQRSQVAQEPQFEQAVERVATSSQQPMPGSIKQTVMQEPVVETYIEPVDDLPQFIDEPEVFIAQEQGNSLRKPGPRGRQISILNRSNADGDENYDLPAEPEFVQDGNDFSGSDAQPDLQLSRPIGPAEGQAGSNDLRRQDDKDSSLRSLLADEEEDDDREAEDNLLEKSCDEFRRELLDNPIRNIALDISPPASELLEPGDAISRDWTDRLGNVVATGRMVDLRRGYVIVDSLNGRIKLAIARLSDADLDAVADYWQIPVTCGVGIRGSVDRCWAPQTFTWTAPSLCHKTLYFENVQLERYGHSHGPFTQPIRSVGHFFVSLISIPYQTAIHPVNECNYALGFYRPGDCAPWLKDPVPISLRGALRQAGVVVGLGYGL